jgi:hypothetical protein
MDQPGVKPLIDFAPQPGHMDVDDVIEGGMPHCFFPDVARQHLAGDNAALVAQKVFEDLEFSGGEFDRFVSAPDGASHEVHVQVAHLQSGGRFGLAAAEQGSHAGEEFGESERLYEIVVRPGVQPFHAIFHGVHRGQEKDRNSGALQAQCGEDLDAAASGQHDIENNQIEWLRIQYEEAFFAGMGDVDRIRFGFKAFLQGTCNFPFVFHDQDSQAF